MARPNADARCGNPAFRDAPHACENPRAAEGDAVSAPRNVEIREGELLAGIDLGSNSFHMVVARYQHGEPRVIDRLRDSVRLAAGLRQDGALDAEHRARALACLARFGQRLTGLAPQHVRAVATNTVRQLRSPQAFLLPAETALGHPVEIVSGREEGRLIFLGVAHGLPGSRHRRLVIDIGGGSTEFIIGRELAPLHAESVQVGCVASTLRFFPGGKLTRKRWQRAREEIGVLLQQFVENYREAGWDEVYGSSGTAKAIESVVLAMGLSEFGVTRAALAGLREALLTFGDIGRLSLPGLVEERAPVLAGGVVILEAAFEALGIERLVAVESAMREGMLWDLIGRAEGRDPRAASIAALARRYGVDDGHAARVEATALALFDQVAPDWSLDSEAREWLSWAARVHEIGLAIAHSQHHRHGAYILRNSDLAGFSRQDQQLLAVTVECHRRKPDKTVLATLPVRHKLLARRITALLRLAVLFHRARRPEPLPPLGLDAHDHRVRLALPPDWLEHHPLTVADLEVERTQIGELGLRLELAVFARKPG